MLKPTDIDILSAKSLWPFGTRNLLVGEIGSGKYPDGNNRTDSIGAIPEAMSKGLNKMSVHLHSGQHIYVLN